MLLLLLLLYIPVRTLFRSVHKCKDRSVIITNVNRPLHFRTEGYYAAVTLGGHRLPVWYLVYASTGARGLVVFVFRAEDPLRV